MNSFAWIHQDLARPGLDGDPLGMVRTKRARQRAKRLYGQYFADLVPVAASCVRVAGNQITGLSGEALAIGQSVYLDATLQTWFRSAAATSGKDAASGIAISACSAAGQPVVVLNDGTSGQINLGCAVAAGAVYIVSSNLGGVVLYVDGTTPTTGWKTCIVGYGISTSVIALVFRASGVAHL